MAAQFSQTTRALHAEGARFSYLAWALAVLLGAIWAVWLLWGSVTVYEVSRRARLEVRQASHHVAALVPSTVLALDLAIGRDVQAGDVLVELDSRSEALRLREEQARLETVPQRIASIRREIDERQRVRDDDFQAAAAALESARFRHREADIAVEFARESERRLGRLSAAGSATMVDALRAGTDAQKLAATRDGLVADMRRSELDALARRHQHEAQIETLRQAIVSLEGEMAVSQATIERLRIEIERHIIRAPISGRLGDVVPLHPGAYVAQGQRLATVVPVGDLIIVADFSPSLTLGRVQPGQAARLRLDGFPWAQYGTIAARVTRVATEIRDNQVRVEFAVYGAPASGIAIQHGLPGSIEVSVEEASPAALVLRAAGLILAGSTRPSVVTLTEAGK